MDYVGTRNAIYKAAEEAMMKLPDMLYHGTSEKNLRQILRDGNVRGISHWGSLRVAKAWQSRIIAVPLSRFDQNSLWPDENAMTWPLVPGGYAGERPNLRRKWKDLGGNMTQAGWKVCLLVYEAVQYDGDIPVTEKDVLSL
jgi:hypothetical protein